MFNLTSKPTPRIPRCTPNRQPLFGLRPILCQNPKTRNTKLMKAIAVNPSEGLMSRSRGGRGRRKDEKGQKQMSVLCGFGYWVQGLRCFPWLALNFHMAHNLNFHPSMLQLIQNSGNLPMVAKPLYGILSDALYIGHAHRIPYVSIGVILQVLSWGALALIPAVGQSLPALMCCVLLSNLGASVAEVANDALIAEYGHKHNIGGLQSYAFMALAVGGLLGNLVGGYCLVKGARNSVSDGIKKQIPDLIRAISDETISRPLAWIVASIAMVPVLSGSIFCYQTQCLNLDPSIIGMSRVIGQLVLLSTTVLYDRCFKVIPMRKLIGGVQVLYASSLLLDLVLVTQVNLKLGISNELFALCFSGLAETIAQFKLLPFTVLFASLSPRGCEGSLTSFLASTLCLSSIISGFLGIGLGSLLGIKSGDYSGLSAGVVVNFVAALVPLLWIHHVPMFQPLTDKERRR